MYKFKYSSKKGFTLIELIAVMPIMIIVLTLTYKFYDFSNKVYKQSVGKTDVQQDVRTIADYIEKEVRSVRGITVVDPKSGDYFSLSLDANKNLIKSTFVSGVVQPNPIKIGAKIDTLSFLSNSRESSIPLVVQKDKGMLEFIVGDLTVGTKYNASQKYSASFKIVLDNLPTNLIPEDATATATIQSKYPAIYYTKY